MSDRPDDEGATHYVGDGCVPEHTLPEFPEGELVEVGGFGWLVVACEVVQALALIVIAVALVARL